MCMYVCWWLKQDCVWVCLVDCLLSNADYLLLLQYIAKKIWLVLKLHKWPFQHFTCFSLVDLRHLAR